MDVSDVAHLLTNVGAICLSVGLMALGVVSMLAPAMASALYGLPTTEAAWVQVAGLRDLGLGGCTLAVYVVEPRVLRVFLIPMLAIPVVDTLLAVSHSRESSSDRTHAALSHVAGTIAVAILTLCAWLDPALKRKKE